jgi:hypothetical protein
MAAAHSRRLLEAVGAAVNLREGEAPLVLLALAHSFLNGVPKTRLRAALRLRNRGRRHPALSASTRRASSI